MSSTKRITKEFGEVSQDPPEGFTVVLPPNGTINTWHVTLRAPPGTAFHPGVFGIVVSLPSNYPFKPPVVKFVTRIYHPNVTDDSLGNICLGLLKAENWKPSTKLRAVLEAVRNLLIEPQPDDPLEERIAEEYRNNRQEWLKKVKLHVEKYAKSQPEFPPVPA